jgi:hypothetical protein
MHQDLAACFTWKQVGLGFPSLASRLVEAWMVHVASSQRLHREQFEYRQVNAMGCDGLCYPYFAVFDVLGTKGNLVF